MQAETPAATRVPRGEGVTDLTSAACTWRVTNTIGDRSVTAQVPGEIHTDLIRANIIDKPYYQDNHRKHRWVGLEDWTWSTEFEVKDAATEADRQHQLLVCEGLDTIAQITLNGQPVAKTSNQFRRYVFAVGRHLKSGKNSLAITFTSPIKYAQRESFSYPYKVPAINDEAQHGEPARNFIRKSQCSFSWDWGPAYPTVGIWQPIYLVDPTRTPWIQDAAVVVTPRFASPSDDDAPPTVESYHIAVAVRYHAPVQPAALQVRLPTLQGVEKALSVPASPTRVTAADDATATPATVNLELAVPASDVETWWPADHGSQPLYAIEIALGRVGVASRAGDDGRHVLHRRVAFRHVDLVEAPYDDQPGTSFFFEVNGVPVYAKGTNWIPGDCFQSRMTVDRVRHMLESCKEVGMNMVRVWGGGIYQPDHFYDLCDELGLMVWQECMFACAMYPASKSFLNNVAAEVSDQVRRLAHHPSIVLWSGNNENEQALVTHWFPECKNNPFLYTVDYDRLYHQVLAPLIAAIDPSRRYISSSPHCGTISRDPWIERYVPEKDVSQHAYGDFHHYNYACNPLDVATYPSPRFSSEFGYQSLPSYAILQTVLDASELTPGPWASKMLAYRNHHAKGQIEMLQQMRMVFPSVPDITAAEIVTKRATTEAMWHAWIYLSQLVQALGLRAQTEHYRRLRGSDAHCMGVLVWQCNDIWPAPTWACIEYDGTWKLAQDMFREFLGSQLVSIVLGTDETDEDTLLVYVCNDAQTPVRDARIVLEVRNAVTGQLVHERIQDNVNEQPLDSDVRMRVSSYAASPFAIAAASSEPADDEVKVTNAAATKDKTIVRARLMDAEEREISSSLWWHPTCLHGAGTQDPELTLRVDQVATFSPMRSTSTDAVVHVTVTAHAAPAYFVHLRLPRLPGRFSQNGFTLMPNESRTVAYMPWSTADLKALAQPITHDDITFQTLYHALHAVQA
ncbi:hypothetical protein CXG81DRAFT_20452 [Caulochytrium protostelioides]|nr:hypothetical protein CXG81DRAFT_20452 [Caulochytrium protostelioides]|eukprot:RKO99459.1 hypothetical protein CXG81DRAFT_20452 [Caulochytrium protostelioides]